MRASSRCQKVRAVYDVLDAAYPEARCTLNFSSAWQLLVAAILSAQCTDERVNLVTAELFAKWPTLRDMQGVSEQAVAEVIRSCGLYKHKAKHIVATVARVLEVYDGEVPREMADLLSLPGVGRKIANLVRGDYFHLGGVVVDTHCLRLSQTIGLSKGKTPPAVERDLTACLEAAQQSRFGHLMVHHGRVCCRARARFCLRCPLGKLCSYAGSRKVRAAIESARAEGAEDATF